MYAHAVPIVLLSERGTPLQRGVHLFWFGPGPWLFCLNGWRVSRREGFAESSFTCEDLTAAQLSELIDYQELDLPALGKLTYGRADEGLWQVVTLELSQPSDLLGLRVTAGDALAYGMRDGKIVAAAPLKPGVLDETLSAPQMDRLVIHAHDLRGLHLCRGRVASLPYAPVTGTDDFRLPITRFAPSGRSFDQLHARQALGQLPGDQDLLRADFEGRIEPLLEGLADELLKQSIRPLDVVLLLRRKEDPDHVDELTGLDPFRVLYLVSAWRRGLGLGWFDDAATGGLVEKETYQYRVEGDFPAQDVLDEIWSFATVPSTTLLPVQFAIGRAVFLLGRPTEVTLWPNPEAVDPDKTRSLLLARRGVRLSSPLAHAPIYFLPWLHQAPQLTLDLAQTIHKGSTLVLELAPDAALRFELCDSRGAILDAGSVDSNGAILARVDGVVQLRLFGNGFLFAVRLRAATTVLGATITLAAETLPIQFVHQEPPAAPPFAQLTSLQQPTPEPIGYKELNGEPLVQTKEPLGFQVRWAPPIVGSPWPAEIGAVPPVEATFYAIEHTATDERGMPLPGESWLPIQGKDRWPDQNWTHAERNVDPRPLVLHPGVDLLSVFPESYRAPLGGNPFLIWKDVFGLPTREPNVASRPLPPLGTYQRYRLASVDLLGRRSPDWRLTNQARLEKHVPPPVPVSPAPLGDDTVPPAPSAPAGVRARVLVRDTPGLDAAEIALLDAKGAKSNLIELSWGWFSQQRELDPQAAEFRLYLSSPPPNLLAGTIEGVSPPDNRADKVVYTLTLRPRLASSEGLPADTAKELYLDAGYPFFIEGHAALQPDTPANLVVSTAIRQVDGSYAVPENGTEVALGIPPTSAMYRPAAWSERLSTSLPIRDDAEVYTHYFIDRLDLRPEHPSDEIWVGVSAADAEDYVVDAFGRKGNESPLAGVSCRGRWRGRPIFDVPVPLAPVPRVPTPEPTGRPIEFTLDLRPHLAYLDALGTNKLGPGDLIFPERLDGESLFVAYRARGGEIIPLSVEDGVPRAEGIELAPIAVPNPDDKAKILRALQSDGLAGLPDQHLVFLAGNHPERDQLFRAALERPIPFGPFKETLSSKSARYVYRVRKAVAGHLSAGGALALLVVRVPSVVPGPIPRKVASRLTDPAGSLRLSLFPAPDVKRVLIYSQELGEETRRPAPPTLIRIPDRPDLLPQLKTPQGELLSALVKDLADPDVTPNFDEASLEFVHRVTGAPGRAYRVWVASLTEDSIPSPLGGGFRVDLPRVPLQAANLRLDAGAKPRLVFQWDLAGSEIFEVALERSADGGRSWTRVSPLLGADSSGHQLTQAAGDYQFRLISYAANGRSAVSPTTITVTV